MTEWMNMKHAYQYNVGKRENNFLNSGRIRYKNLKKTFQIPNENENFLYWKIIFFLHCDHNL
jgi:hypothetical protein